MALLPCPECGNEISDKAMMCPVCGYSRRGAFYCIEYKSPTMLFGLPLLHIVMGPAIDPSTGKLRIAKGIIAVGGIAVGWLAIGGFAAGVIAFGGVGLGLLAALGGVGIGLGFAAGGLAVGTLAVGGCALGYYAVGGLPIGIHTLPAYTKQAAMTMLQSIRAIFTV